MIENRGRDLSSAGWNPDKLKADSHGMLTDSEALFVITNRAANVITFARRHPKATTLGLMGAIYGVGLAADALDFVTQVHAQGADNPLSCVQIDSVQAAHGSTEKVVQPIINNAAISSHRVLECVDYSGGLQQRALDCEGISLAGYGGLDEQSTDQNALCVNNAGVLQPVTGGALENVRDALRSMFPQPAEAIQSQSVAVEVNQPVPAANTSAIEPQAMDATQLSGNTPVHVQRGALDGLAGKALGSLGAILTGGVAISLRRRSRQSEKNAALLDADYREGSEDWGTHDKYNREDGEDGRKSRKPKKRGGGRGRRSKVDEFLDASDIE